MASKRADCKCPFSCDAAMQAATQSSHAPRFSIYNASFLRLYRRLCSPGRPAVWVESKRDARIGRWPSAPAGDDKRYDPPVKSLARQNEELSRATVPVETNCLSNLMSDLMSICPDKIRKMLYVLLLTESSPARRLPGRGEESPRLFDNLPDHNPRASLRRRRISLFESVVTL
jgi:hypothetical protein